jgi:hypothetical protein
MEMPYGTPFHGDGTIRPQVWKVMAVMFALTACLLSFLLRSESVASDHLRALTTQQAAQIQDYRKRIVDLDCAATRPPAGPQKPIRRSP